MTMEYVVRIKSAGKGFAGYEAEIEDSLNGSKSKVAEPDFDKLFSSIKSHIHKHRLSQWVAERLAPYKSTNL